MLVRVGEGAAKKTLVRSQMSVKDSTTASRNKEPDLDLLLKEPANFTSLASLLRRFGKAKALSDARRVHDHLSKHGYDRNTFIGNCLLQMYGDCGSLVDVRVVSHKISSPNLYTWNILIKAYGQNGSLDDAKLVFEKMPLRNVISWNAMISAFGQSGHGSEALYLFHQMQAEGIELNDITLVCALDACTSLVALEEGQEIHTAIVESGHDQDVIVATAVVNMYGKCGTPHNAWSIFYKMSHRNVVSWNAMIAAFAHNRYSNEALDLFHQMLLEGIDLSHVTFICSLDACSSADEGHWIHRVIVDKQYEQNVVVGTALVNMYGKCGILPDAKSVFDRMCNRSVVSWNTIISTFTQNGQCEDALNLFHQMCSEGVEPNNITFVCSLNACTKVALVKGHAIHAAIIGSGCEGDIMVGTALVDMYGKCGHMCDARNVFHRMPQRNDVCWTAMIAASARNGHVVLALDLFHQMQVEDVKPDNIAFGFAIDACADLEMLEVGKELDSAVNNSGYGQDVVLGNSLINMYGKCRSINDAEHVFGRMPHRNVVSWTSMMTALTQNGLGKNSLHLYHQMQLEGVLPDEVAFVCAIDACAILASLKDGHEIDAAVVDSGLGQNEVVGTALIYMYGKCGSPLDVKRVFSRMPCQDVVSWTAMIAAFAQNGYGEEALALFCQMQLEGIKPNGVTFIGVMTACSHAGLIDDGRRFFVSMERDHGLTHTMDHLMCLVDLLGRAGLLEEAEGLIYSVSCEKVAAVWLSLLSVCRTHGDIERAERAANHCFVLDSKNEAPYVMLSNVYVEAGRWNDAAVIRDAMKKNDVQKSIETYKIGLEFVAGVFHPQTQKIHAELQQITRQVCKARDVALR